MPPDLPALPEDLIACPTCDALYKAVIPAQGSKMACTRCHRVLISPSRHAGAKIILLALASFALVMGAVFQPFLSIKRFWITREATLMDTALAFEGPLLILSVAVLVLVILLPILRLALTVYVLTPLVMNRPPLPFARTAFRMAETLRPWSMAEIFAIGAAVAMIKIVDLAHVSLGPAVWMFAGFVALLSLQNTLMCRWSVWKALDDD
ncbi:paraquat-inducible protein A [Rhodobacteraceae bacterium]|nr:paraquat-inducible protein A [Paracoccaceae bacterium]